MSNPQSKTKHLPKTGIKTTKRSGPSSDALTQRRRRARAPARQTPSKRSHGSRAPTVHLPLMPPSLSISSNIGTHWIRNYVTVNSSINFVDNVGSDVFFNDTHYSEVYGEFKIRHVNVWYVPQTAVVTTPGNYAFAVIDSGEVRTAGEFKTIALMPGSTLRKLYQPASGCWYPTEPSDREWRPFDNKWSIFCIRIATTGTNKLDGYCVYDAHVSFRATSAALKESVARSPLSDQDVPTEGTHSLEARVQQLEQLLQKATLAFPN